MALPRCGAFSPSRAIASCCRGSKRTGNAAENAVHMLRSLVRGYVLHEVMQTLQGVDCYDAAFDKAVQVFVAGLPAFASQAARAAPHEDAACERQPLGG